MFMTFPKVCKIFSQVSNYLKKIFGYSRSESCFAGIKEWIPEDNFSTFERISHFIFENFQVYRCSIVKNASKVDILMSIVQEQAVDLKNLRWTLIVIMLISIISGLLQRRSSKN